ncbi:MAG: hypothetical protein ORN21_01355 [Methylophilaceae bacterium]|nr:hypothetical protein [Methylophilaceae bacterium]
MDKRYPSLSAYVYHFRNLLMIFYKLQQRRALQAAYSAEPMVTFAKRSARDNRGVFALSD